MKKTLEVLLLLICFFYLGRPESDIEVGGYSPIDINELEGADLAEYNKAKDTAIDELYYNKAIVKREASVISAEEQVVAGMNYKFLLEGETQEGLLENIIAVVYCDLEGDCDLSSYKIVQPQEQEPDEGDDIAGGWADINPSELSGASLKEYNQAKNLAIRELRKKDVFDEDTKVSVARAEDQVVNGWNYKFYLVEELNEGGTKEVEAVVYCPPEDEGPCSLSNYQVISDDDPANESDDTDDE